MSLDVNIETEEFSTSELHDSINEVAKIKGIDNFEYHVELASDKNESYIANLFRVVIKEVNRPNDDIEKDDKHQSGEKSEAQLKKINVIVKTLINTTRQELFSELHEREVFVYDVIMPKFRKLQEDLEESYKIFIPECIYSNKDKGREVIVLEDLKDNKFATDGKLAKFERLDYLQVRLVMSELAKLHGLSFVLERLDSESYKAITSRMNDLLFEDKFLNKSKLRNYFNDSFSIAIDMVSDDEIKKKLNKIETKLMDILRGYVDPSKHISVLCHGDCWINNMLFRHEERKQSRVCFIDFQTMRYASPITDIVYFMYLCTDSTFRLEHFDTLINVYYDSFKNFLNQFDVDVTEIYKKDDFFKDVNEITPFGVLLAMIEMKIVTTTHHSTYSLITEDFENTDTIRSDNKLFAIRINDLVKEFNESGLLDKLLDEMNLLNNRNN